MLGALYPHLGQHTQRLSLEGPWGRTQAWGTRQLWKEDAHVSGSDFREKARSLNGGGREAKVADRGRGCGAVPRTILQFSGSPSLVASELGGRWALGHTLLGE